MRTIVLALSLCFSGFASADHHGKMPEPTKEERAAMAEMHTKMAECLKTEKAVSDCHKEMMDACPMAKEGKKCPMMAMHHGGHHRMKKDKANKAQ